MSDRHPPARWARARTDWRGVRGRRDFAIAIVGAALSAGGLWLAGFPHDAVVTVVTAAGSGIALAVIVPAADLWWCWLQAPMRTVVDQLVEISTRLDRVGTDEREPTLGLRHTLMNSRRVGEELVAEWSGYRESIPEGVAQQWTNSVINTLSELMPNGLESFLTAGSGSNAERLPARIYILAGLLAPAEPSRPAADKGPIQPLSDALQALLIRGRTLVGRARIGQDGSSMLVETWEEDVRATLTAHGREDLVVRFERPATGDKLRGLWSGATETRGRFSREISLLAEFVRELAGPSGV